MFHAASSPRVGHGINHAAAVSLSLSSLLLKFPAEPATTLIALCQIVYSRAAVILPTALSPSVQIESKQRSSGPRSDRDSGY